MSATDNANLTINDLQTVLNIIDLATQRGAFKGSELMTVGSQYEKVKNFLSQVQAQTAAAPAPASDAGTSAQGEE